MPRALLAADDLKERVELQTQVQVRDAMGHVTRGWETREGDRLWAKVLPVSSRDRLTQQQRHAEVTHVVSIRFRSNVTPTNRILYRGRVLSIVSVINVEENKERLDLLCEEKQ